MPPHFTHQRRVQFSDTDMAGIVHFSNFYRFMEEAEHEMFRSLGYKIVENQPDGSVVGWPRVRASCSFEAPAYYDDLIDIDITVARVGVKSLTMSFHFRRGELRLATGELKTVYCRFEHGGKFRSIAIPAGFAEKLDELSRDAAAPRG
jgi:acyl-CoA thioester hydrolase